MTARANTPEAILRAGELAEESAARLLGAVLWGRAPALQALATLPPSPPLGDRLSRLLGAVLALLDAGGETNEEALTRHLLATGSYREGDAVFLAECTSKPTTNAPACAGDVWALCRELEKDVLRTEIRVRSAGGESLGDLPDRLEELERKTGSGALMPDCVCGAPSPPPPVFGHGPLPGTFCILTGDSAAGKTWATLTFGLSVALGRPLWPSMSPTEKRPVVCVTYEDSPALIGQRLHAIAAEHGIPWCDVAEAESSGMLSIFCTPEQPLLVADGTGRPQPTSAWRQIKRHVLALRPGLVVVDPLAAAMQYPENDNGSASLAAAYLRNLATRSGAAVMLTAHTGKGGAGEAGQHAMRGASSMTGACRWHARLIREGEGDALKLIVAKNSAGPRPAPLMLEARTGGCLVEIGPALRDPAQLERLIIDWFSQHPDAAVTPGGVLTKRGDANNLVSDVAAACRWARPKDVNEAVQNLITVGRLAPRTERTAGRHQREVLELLEPVYSESEADDVPF